LTTQNNVRKAQPKKMKRETVTGIISVEYSNIIFFDLKLHLHQLFAHLQTLFASIYLYNTHVCAMNDTNINSGELLLNKIEISNSYRSSSNSVLN
jgi:hypothetical protein